MDNFNLVAGISSILSLLLAIYDIASGRQRKGKHLRRRRNSKGRLELQLEPAR